MNLDALPIAPPRTRTLPDAPSNTALETLKSGLNIAGALAENIAEPDRLALARSFGARLIFSWWQSVTATDHLLPALREPLAPFERVDLSVDAEALADKLGAVASELDAEMAAYQIGAIYARMLPRAHRAAMGIYYTPPSLTARLIAQATASGVDWATCRVLDPACGGGAFLVPVARQIVSHLPTTDPLTLIENIQIRLQGYEIDPFAAWLAQIALDVELLPFSRVTRRQLRAVATVCDSLRECPPDGRFDLVIGNPPYGRVRLRPADRCRFKRGLFGHANLYGLFTDLALRHTRSDGVVAFVTPTSFLAGEYFKNLRNLLGGDAPPKSFDFVSVRKGVFDDVLQETLLATYKRGSNCAPVAVHEITPINGSGLSSNAIGSFALPSDLSKPWILPRCAEQSSLVAKLDRMTHRLADWGYKVSTGPLVWNRHKDQLAARPGNNRHPLIWAEAVNSTGRFTWRAEKKNHALWFEIRDGDEWLMMRKQCVLLQRTTAKEQSRRLIAAALPNDLLEISGAVVIENHLNMLRPLDERQPVFVAVLAAFLNSRAADHAFRCVSGSVAVSAYELEALPLPAPESLRALKRLVHINASRAQIEAECFRLYNLED